ncbi:OppA family ABC transporter substrate-binding lipoprotein [Mycoplasmopsis opalescens]|uniref:OppA family ABC transporter substrate-binding lipoprotein n=1 Tax=Mycoplasmopsis opalescens TaxID=114886 RepID=UPI0004A6D00E|nr:hypothetical protein [Mycoplasmopsis opalescens]
MKLKKVLLSMTAVSTLTSVALVVSCGPKQKKDVELSEITNEIEARGFKGEVSKKLIESFAVERESAKKANKIATDFADEGIFRALYSTEYSEKSYEIDKSAAYGSLLNIPEDALVSGLVRIESIGRPHVMEENGKKEIKYPSLNRLKLELADKIIVTVDGKEHVFDQDDVDTYPKPDKDGKYYNNTRYKAYSTNKNSVNSENFLESLKKATKVQFAIRKDVFWSKQNGEKTNYTVNGEDFWISWLRTNYLTSQRRWKDLPAGSVKTKKVKGKDGKETEVLYTEIDEAAALTASEGTNYFTSQRRYPNKYLYALYGVDADKFDKKETFVSEYQGQSAVTFEKTAASQSALWYDLITNIIASGYEFVPAPSKYIKELDEKEQWIVKPFESDKTGGKSKEQITQELKDKIRLLEKNNPLRTSGIYWYGVSNEGVLGVGPYLYKGYKKNGEVTLEKNPNYYDKLFVNNTKSGGLKQTGINKIVLAYKKIDDSQIKTTLYQEFISGRLASVQFSQLEASAENEVKQNPEVYGLSYAKEYNTNKLRTELTPQLLPSFDATETTAENLEWYNDNFAKLMYGVSKEELTKVQDQKAASILSTSYAGTGLVFRTIIGAALNHAHFTNQLYSSKTRPWLVYVPQDGQIGGTDALNSDKKTPIDYYDTLNSVYAVDKDINKVKDKNNKTEVSVKDATDAISQTSGDGAYKSPMFEELKSAMKQLLDQVYRTYNIPATEKIEFSLIHRYTNWGPISFETESKKLVETLNQLDSRLDIKYEKYGKNEIPKIYASLFYNKAWVTAAGWGNDVDNIGSSWDGMINVSAGIGALGLLAHDEVAQNKLKASFPEVVELAKAFSKYIDDNSAATASNDKLFVVPEELKPVNWKNMPIHVVGTISDNFVHIEKKENKYVISEKANTATDLGTIRAQFLLTYARNQTNAKNIELTKQLAHWIGITNYDNEKNVLKETFSPVLLAPTMLRADTGENGLWFQDIILI